MKFYDREEELKALENSAKKSNMVVITGRRRVGKTSLIEEMLKTTRGSLVTIVPKEEKQVANDFYESFSKLGFCPRFTTMKEVLEYFFNNEKIRLLCIDEFSNFLEVNKAIPYEMQKLWDENQTNSHSAGRDK